MSASASSPTGPAASPGMPSQGVRTVISFLLFAHFLAIAITLAGTFPQDAMSPLRQRLLRAMFLVSHLQTLNMFTDYAFNLTYGDTLDVDHFFQVELPPEEGSAEPRVVQLPDESIGPLSRRKRYFNLNRNAANIAQDGRYPDMEGVLPQAVAARLMAENGALEANLSLVGHRLQSMEDVGSADPESADPYSDRFYAPVYSAKAWDENGRVQLLKTTTGSFAAPTAGPEPPPGARGARRTDESNP